MNSNQKQKERLFYNLLDKKARDRRKHVLLQKRTSDETNAEPQHTMDEDLENNTSYVKVSLQSVNTNEQGSKFTTNKDIFVRQDKIMALLNPPATAPSTPVGTPPSSPARPNASESSPHAREIHHPSSHPHNHHHNHVHHHRCFCFLKPAIEGFLNEARINLKPRFSFYPGKKHSGRWTDHTSLSPDPSSDESSSSPYSDDDHDFKPSRLNLKQQANSLIPRTEFVNLEKLTRLFRCISFEDPSASHHASTPSSDAQFNLTFDPFPTSFSSSTDDISSPKSTVTFEDVL